MHWTSSRQAFVAQSTCEAELVTTVTGANLGQSFVPIIQEIRPGDPIRRQILNDNMAAIGILVCDASSWRTRHLRIRANALREKIANFEWEAAHTSGEYNIADAGTKVLTKGRLDWLKTLMGLGTEPREPSSGSSQGIAKRIAGSLYALVVAMCVNPVDGARDSSELEASRFDPGDWALVFLLGLWTVAVIALWEGAKDMRQHCVRLCPLRRPETRDLEEEPPLDGDLDGYENQVEGLGEQAPLPGLREVEGLRARVFPQAPQGVEGDAAAVGSPAARNQARVVGFDELRQAANVRNQHGLRVHQRQAAAQAPPNRPPEPEEQEARGRNEEELLRVEDVARLAQLARDYLDDPPNPPLRFNVWWNLPVQLSCRELRLRRTAWGGEISSLHQVPEEATDVYEYPGSGRLNVLIRWHGEGRVRLFTPERTNLPFPQKFLTGERRTLATFVDGTQDIVDDLWMDPQRSRAYLRRRWQGRTELRVDPLRLTGEARHRFEQVSRVMLQNLYPA